MSQYEKLVELIGRVERCQEKVNDKSGKIWNYSAEVNGKRQQYKLLNAKSPVDYEDEISNLLIWIWGYKDHVRKYLEEKGYPPSQADAQVQQFIRKNKNIMICCDVANNIKHSGLDSDGITGLRPELKEVGFSAPQDSWASLNFMFTGEIILDIADPKKVTYHAKIRDKNGNYLGDALNIIDEAIGEWEAFLKLI